MDQNSNDITRVSAFKPSETIALANTCKSPYILFVFRRRATLKKKKQEGTVSVPIPISVPDPAQEVCAALAFLK